MPERTEWGTDYQVHKLAQTVAIGDVIVIREELTDDRWWVRQMQVSSIELYPQGSPERGGFEVELRCPGQTARFHWDEQVEVRI